MNIFAAERRLPAAAPNTARVVANFAIFQIGWFACVLGAAHDLPWAGTIIATVIVATHIFCARRPLEECKLIAIALVIGAVWDSLLVTLGWLDFKSGFLVDGMAPHWILALWALFAITLNLSLAWLKVRLLAAAILGAVAGPLAYWGGVRLGAVSFVEPLPAAVALSIGWALFTPLLARLARRYDGVRTAG
jgi:hypothetical protein